MKRFLLFCGMQYYPSGGWNDLRDKGYDTLEEALKAAANRNADWWHIVDLNEGRIVEFGHKED